MTSLEKLFETIKNHEVKLTENDIFNFIKNRKRWPHHYPWSQPTIEFITSESIGSQENIFDIDNYINFNEWLKIYNLGYTSVISNVLDLNENLRNLNNKIKNIFGKFLCGNFYINNGKKNFNPSWKLHSHDYDVIVKMIYGKCEWQINDIKEVFNHKNTIYISKNVPHAVLKIIKPKLSLTLNII